MPHLDNAEKAIAANPNTSTADSSVGKFFQDAYDKTVNVIENHPKESVVGAVGVVAGAAAAIALTRGRVLPEMLGFAGREAGAELAPATESLVRSGMPIGVENRAAASNPAVLRTPPWLRGDAIRGADETDKFKPSPWETR